MTIQVERLPALVFDVGSCGIEVGVVGNDVIRPHDLGEEDAFGGPSLMGGDHLRQAGQIPHRVEEAEEGPAPCVRLVAVEHPRPLGRGHGAGAGVGQQIDRDLISVEPEEVVTGADERHLTLLG